MSPALQVTLSGGLSFGLPLVLALHELIALRRRHGPPGDGSGKPPEPGPKPAPSGIGNLPICPHSYGAMARARPARSACVAGTCQGTGVTTPRAADLLVKMLGGGIPLR